MTRWRPQITAAAIALLLATSARADSARTTVAILELQDKGAGPDLTDTLVEVIATTLAQLDVFQVVSRADIERLLAAESSRQAMGCEEALCLAELGGALGVALLVSGSLGKVGDGYVLNLTLTDTVAAKVIEREQRTVAGAGQLTEQTAAAARFLVRGLLAGAQGDLVITSSQEGADVEVDGRIIGSTPLGRVRLAGGPHTLRVNKSGFVAWSRDVQVEKDGATVVEATLVPSLEFIEAYDRSAFTFRVLAYATGGLGVALLGLGTAGLIWNGERAGSYEADLQRTRCRAGDAPPDPDLCTAFAARRNDIQSLQPVAVVGLVGGVAAALAGVVLFIAGPEVGAYDSYKASTAAPTLAAALTPLPGGAAVVLATRFSGF